MEGGGGEEGNDYLVNEGCFLRFLVVNFFSFVFFCFFFFFVVNFKSELSCESVTTAAAVEVAVETPAPNPDQVGLHLASSTLELHNLGQIAYNKMQRAGAQSSQDG